MAGRRLDTAELPGWPRMMSRDLAAAYVGVSPSTFDLEVAEGLLPKPLPRGRKGGLDTWDRMALDDALDLRTGRRQAEGSNKHWLDRLDDGHAPR
ncbi:hypothetical protein [Ferrovibrio xuzhouensis]|uniref:AlpA family transcriptional regulator n=1 Tax=Ferrovibrio xuzhouensis TaxID=1576914 RepID=A0ABV7VCB7_9PROT